MRTPFIVLLLGLVAAVAPLPAAAGIQVYESPPVPASLDFKESPALVPEVTAGTLPPVRQRLPKVPGVLPMTNGRVAGKPGGSLRTLIAKAKGTRLLVVYGYARLIGYDENLKLVPDIVERLEVEDGRIFTFTLREGHRWSDGHPFTSEDFRYYWEDVAGNEDISPTGLPSRLLVGGQAPKVEFPDAVTVRYSWPAPNPDFLSGLAGASPLFIYRPAHYLKQFHGRYADAETLEKLVEENHASSWFTMHTRKGNQYRFSNPDLPTLQPWVNTTSPPSERFLAARNPYYHRVDPNGQQLPYIDKVVLYVASSSLIPAKTGAGDSHLQARGLHFSDYTFLKAGEARSGYQVNLWRTVRGSAVALYPNLTANDPVWREVLRDVRFRRALSLAIDRHELNQVIYFGLGLEGNQSILPGSPLYKAEYRGAYADFNPEEANRLLDAMGLTGRDKRGVRLLPDGRPLEMVVETAGENTEEVDLLELIHDSWLKAGIKLYSKPSQRDVLRNRIFTGETLASMWFGYENALPRPEMSPDEFAPVRQYSYHWPKWGQYHETKGMSGEPVDMAAPKELLALYNSWRITQDRAEQEKIWHRMLAIQADQVFTIGLVAQIPQPVVVANNLRNVPREAMFNWDPGAQFGIYRPDGFWFAE